MSVTTNGGLPPAGWYADPQVRGQQRWWTGTEWIEHTRDGAGAGDYGCPRCGSAATMTLAQIRAQGIRSGSGSASGWVQDTSGQGHSVTLSAYTTTETGAARAAAPPTKRSGGAALIAIGLIGGAVLVGAGVAVASNGAVDTAHLLSILGVAGGLLAVVCGLGVLLFDIEHNRNVFPEEWDRWNRSWQCRRCGEVFEV